MDILLLIALGLQSGSAAPAAKESPPARLPSYLEVTVDSTQTNARGLQIVSVRLKMKPQYGIYFSANPSDALKLVVTTRDPKTQIHVIHPQGRKNGTFVPYADDFAIQVLIQRADGDRSPVEGRLDFRGIGIQYLVRGVWAHAC